MNRFLLTALVFLGGTMPLGAQLDPAELEEASEVARRAAKAAVAGPQRIFVEALDADQILDRRMGLPTWTGLSERQRDQLRSVVREHFLQALGPSRPTTMGAVA